MISFLSKFKIIALQLLFLAVLAGCYKDGPPEQYQPAIQSTSKGTGVFISNEGNFQFGNASLSYLDLSSGIVTEDLYEQRNGSSLGDVCQSVYVFNGKIYLVINNSGKVEVCNSVSFKREGTINDLNSPRYFLPVSNNKAYITDLYAKSIAVADLSANAVINRIQFPGESGPLLQMYGMAFITSSNREYLYLINTRNDALEDSVLIATGANSIRQDNQGNIWVACSSNSKTNSPGALYKIDPVQRKVIQTLKFTTTNFSPWRLCSNATNDTLYFLNEGVYRIAANAASLPETEFILQKDRNFYGLGVDPVNGTVYVADALDYVQRGRIYRYNSNGKEIDSFLAGIIPGDFWFQ